MTTSGIISMAGDYLKLGIAAGGILVIAFLAGYFILYKRAFRGKKRLRPKTVVLWAVFVCYLAVVCGAVFGRGTGWDRAMLMPFSSYLDAWGNFSMYAWRNLILNILLFVPFGFLLPWMGGIFRKAWKTYAAGGAVSLLIEMIQLVFHLGIFESDDILNNFLGTVIGYGFYRLLRFLLSLVKEKKEKFSTVLLYQIPLCLTAGAFCAVFLVYEGKEFGNLRSTAYYKVSMKGVEIRLNTELAEEEKEVPIYLQHRADKEETLELAQDFLAGIGTQVDMSRNDYYENTAIYYSEDGHSLWIKYAGCTMEFYDYSAGWENGEKVAGKEGAGREEVEERLLALGVSLPEAAGFENLGEGRYRFAVEQYIDDGIMYDGVLTCKYHVNGKISDMDNHIITYQEYREGRIKTEAAAYEELQAGKFVSELWDEKLTELDVWGVRLEYETDSKGYYQPVYVFDVLYNHKDGEIVIPAL